MGTIGGRQQVGVWKRKRRAPALSFPLLFLSSIREGNSRNAYIDAFSFLLSKHRKRQSYSAKLLLRIKPIGIVAYTLCGRTFVKTAVYKKEPEEDTVQVF